MATALKFDSKKIDRIVKIIANVGDSGGQVRSMREQLVSEFKGAARKPLDKAVADMFRDRFESEFKARSTISESSVGPMTSDATKVATWMPVILGVSAENFAIVGKSWGTLKKFGTQLNKHEGDVDAALATFTKAAKKDYKKSSAAHLKALLGMNDGKFWNAAEKALIVALADLKKIDLGERGTDARNNKLAASAL